VVWTARACADRTRACPTPPSKASFELYWDAGLGQGTSSRFPWGQATLVPVDVPLPVNITVSGAPALPTCGGAVQLVNGSYVVAGACNYTFSSPLTPLILNYTGLPAVTPGPVVLMGDFKTSNASVLNITVAGFPCTGVSLTRGTGAWANASRLTCTVPSLPQGVRQPLTVAVAGSGLAKPGPGVDVFALWQAFPGGITNATELR
jgi:hypothetical protein